VVAQESFPALGTTAMICVSDTASLNEATQLLHSVIDDIDHSCSRFRDDSDLSRVNAHPGETTPISDALYQALEVALDAARITDGILDPTVGNALRTVGYDQSFATIATAGPRPGAPEPSQVPGWQQVHLDPTNRTVTTSEDMQLDLGATAKAFTADRAATRIHDALGIDVLISLGGDIRVVGAPAEGWSILIADDHRAPLDSPGPVISIHGGGLATSSTSVRRWAMGGHEMHHLIDPRTGTSANSPWKTVSAVGTTCVAANTATSTAIILGSDAPKWLEERGIPARLVTADERITYTCGWPEDRS
jgi:thiamine biosynthesis lipoprotein